MEKEYTLNTVSEASIQYIYCLHVSSMNILSSTALPPLYQNIQPNLVFKVSSKKK